MRTVLLIAVMGLAAATLAMAQTPTGADLRAMTADSQKTAEAGLGTLKELVTENTAQRMGFDTPDQAGEARIGPAIADYMIGLEPLRDYRPGQDPDDLILSTGLIHFLVEAAGATRCSITVQRTENDWRAVSFGAPLLSRALATALTSVKGDPAESFMVRIPAFNLTFLAYRSEGQLMLIAVQTAGSYGIEEGSTAPAEEVLARLQPEAERHDGLPR
jgi:hypothetical protein